MSHLLCCTSREPPACFAAAFICSVHGTGSGHVIKWWNHINEMFNSIGCCVLMHCVVSVISVVGKMSPFMTWSLLLCSFQTLFKNSCVSSFNIDLLAVSLLPYDPDPRSLSVCLSNTICFDSPPAPADDQAPKCTSAATDWKNGLLGFYMLRICSLLFVYPACVHRQEVVCGL